MKRTDNYAIQVQQAKALFLGYDQQALAEKNRLRMDEEWLYAVMLCKQYRISRTTGDMQRQDPQGWVDADSHSEVMTLLDLICDSAPNRYICGRWKSTESFGRQFHRSLTEEGIDPDAEFFARDPQAFDAACRALNGQPIDQGDVSYAIELFDGLPMGIQLWLGDDEFPSRLRLMWDENALQYLRYETMYFARGLLLRRLKELMK